MSSSLKLLCRCDDASDAEAIRLRLDAAGIPALIAGVDSIHVGLQAGPKVEVAEEDFDRAIQILVSDLQKTKQAERWKCSACAERNDASFELCWNCQNPRDDLDQSSIQSLPAPTVPPNSNQTPREDSNPYRPVLLDESAANSTIRSSKRAYQVITATFAVLLLYFLIAAVF